MAERDRFPVVVHVLVTDHDRRIALLRRARTGFMDGFYVLPGGHQNHGESVRAAAARECQEELGIVPGELHPACVLPYISGRHQGVNFVFSCADYDGEPRVNEPELFDELVWATPGALPGTAAEWIPVALELAAGGGWYRELEWD
jgi:8-oxo-dGTP pyrophosphatase MutT (NUDIX family)